MVAEPDIPLHFRSALELAEAIRTGETDSCALTRLFLDRLEELLAERAATVRRYRKERFSKIAAPELKREIAAECDIAIEALAD